MKNTFKPAVFLRFLCFSLHAVADDGWVEIATSKNNVWDIKSGSLDLTKNKSDVPIAVVIGRVTDTKTTKIFLYKWYVPMSDCAKENGSVVSLDMSGVYQYENDFVFSSGNVASELAEAICGAAGKLLEEQNKKGL